MQSISAKFRKPSSSGVISQVVLWIKNVHCQDSAEPITAAQHTPTVYQALAVFLKTKLMQIKINQYSASGFTAHSIST